MRPVLVAIAWLLGLIAVLIVWLLGLVAVRLLLGLLCLGLVTSMVRVLRQRRYCHGASHRKAQH